MGTEQIRELQMNICRLGREPRWRLASERLRMASHGGGDGIRVQCREPAQSDAPGAAGHRRLHQGLK